jgi:GNAT superfamily N-acetyltransferase
VSVLVQTLPADDVALVAQIDRSEEVAVEYFVAAGQLRTREPTMVAVPSWDHDGSGPHSVAAHEQFCARVVTAGGHLLGAYGADGFLGLAVVQPDFEPRLAWLAFLHVSREHRRLGAATALWNRAVDLGRLAGDDEIYVSATPTGSAVGFYLGRGCRLAVPPHPRLYAEEPDDIHLVCPITSGS